MRKAYNNRRVRGTASCRSKPGNDMVVRCRARIPTPARPCAAPSSPGSSCSRLRSTGLNVTLAASCVTFVLVQLLAMTVGTVGVAAGLLVWAFSRFRSRAALYVALGALALDVAAMVLKNVFTLIGIECIG